MVFDIFWRVLLKMVFDIFWGATRGKGENTFIISRVFIRKASVSQHAQVSRLIDICQKHVGERTFRKINIGQRKKCRAREHRFVCSVRSSNYRGIR